MWEGKTLPGLSQGEEEKEGEIGLHSSVLQACTRDLVNYSSPSLIIASVDGMGMLLI